MEIGVIKGKILRWRVDTIPDIHQYQLRAVKHRRIAALLHGNAAVRTCIRYTIIYTRVRLSSELTFM